MLVFFVFLIPEYIFGQIRILDIETNESIPYVEVFSIRGELIGVSDVNGVINSTILNVLKLSESNEFTLNHMAYEELIYQKNDLLKIDNLKLKPKNWNLDEFVFTAKKQKYYLKLNGFYRSYQINDGVVRHYAEGKIELLYPPNLKKYVQNKRIEERYFTDKKYLKTDSKGQTILYKMVGPPIPDSKVSIADIEKDFKVSKIHNNQYNIISKEDNQKVGSILKNNITKIISYDIAYISPENEKKYSGFGQESIFRNRNIYSIFKNTDISKTSIGDLVYLKQLTRLKTKYKKDLEFQNIESVSELYITNVEYLKSKPKGFGNFTGVKNRSFYSTNFWEELEKSQLYHELPQGISTSIKLNLSELKNIN